MSDTPRTDAAVVYMAHVAGVDPEFARMLELKPQVAERSAKQWEATALLYAQNSEYHQQQLAEARKDAIWRVNQMGDLQQQLAAARSDALEQITLALGEHPDTPIETIVAQILAIRAEARRSADARAEQRKEDVRLLREMHGPQLWRLYGHGARWTLGTVADWLEKQPC